MFSLGCITKNVHDRSRREMFIELHGYNCNYNGDHGLCSFGHFGHVPRGMMECEHLHISVISGNVLTSVLGQKREGGCYITMIRPNISAQNVYL
jgi:hypothetical protein